MQPTMSWRWYCTIAASSLFANYKLDVLGYLEHTWDIPKILHCEEEDDTFQRLVMMLFRED